MPYFLLCILAIAYAHNWVHGDSRAGGRASQLLPMPPRAGPRQPHRNVGPGQDFILEWTTGHTNSDYYFIILKATDEDQVGKHNEVLFADYINNAPDSAYIYTDPKYERAHISCSNKYPDDTDGRDDCAETGWNNGNGYERELTPSDPQWIDRSVMDPNPASDMTQFKHSTEQLSGDRRVAYYNENYPWIEAIHKFKVSISIPREWDSTYLSLPARQGSGEYMIHMMWHGYADVIDVDVLPQDAVDIYGAPSTDISWVKTEHCQYPTYDDRNNRCRYIQPGETVDQCLSDCEDRGPSACSAANVVPLYNPDMVKIRGHTIDDSNIPWLENDPEGSSRCKKTDIPADADENTMICYGFMPENPIDPTFNPETESIWYIRKNDPEDPIFYSTCYRLDFKLVFTGNAACPLCESASVEETQSWKVGYECVSCTDAAETRDLKTPKFWQLSEVCEQCS